MAQRSNSVLVAAAILVAAAVIGYAVFSRTPGAKPTGPGEPPPTAGDTSRPAPDTPDPDDAVTVIDQTTDTTHPPASDAGGTQDRDPAPGPISPPATLVDAAERGDLAALSAMLGAGADPNGTDDNGRTALMAAAGAGHLDAVFALLDAGADLTTRDNARRAARDYALARYDEAGQSIARVLGEAAGPPPVQDPGDK
jgi:hypothetical protein